MMKKQVQIWAICLTAILSGISNSYSQEGVRAFRIRVKVNADACGMCNHKPIETVFLGLNDANRTKVKDIIGSFNYGEYGVWQYVRVPINPSNSYALHWYDPTGAGWQRFVLNDYISTAIQVKNYHDGDGGISWHSVWMDAEVETYDPVEISDVQYDPCVSSVCNGSNQCVASAGGNLKFTFTVTNTNGPDGMYIQALDSNLNLIREVYLGSYSTPRTVKFSDLNLQNHWGEKIYFRTRTDVGGGVPYIWLNSQTKLKRFYLQIPAPTAYSVSTKACYPDVLFKLTLDASTVPYVNQLEFRMRRSGATENLSNVVELEPYGSMSGNTISLRVKNSLDNALIPNGTNSYIFQIYMDGQTVTDKFNDMQCARTTGAISMNISRPTISLTAQPVEYKFVRDDGVTEVFHTTQAGAANAAINLTLTTKDLNNFYFTWSTNGGTWSTIPSNRLQTISTNVRRLMGLSAGTQYEIKLYDVDGCTTATQTVSNMVSPGTLNVPVPVASPVTCNANNDIIAGVGSKNDGSFTASWTGGIGPFTAYLYPPGSSTPVQTTSNIKKYNTPFVNLSTGTYNLKISDSQGVNQTKAVSVGQSAEIVLTASTNYPACPGQSNGTLLLSVANPGTSSLTFDLTGKPSQTTSTYTYSYFSNLAAGTYTAMVTNSNGCRDIVSNAQVTQFTPVTITTSTTRVSEPGGSNGSLSLSLSGGTEPYYYSVTRGSTLIDQDWSATNNYTGLIAGSYSIDLEDEMGCNASKNNILIAEPSAALALGFTKKDVDCYGTATGEVYPAATGGWAPYRYGFNSVEYGSVATIGNLPVTANHDTVFVIDDMGIVRKQEVVINQPMQMEASIANIYDLQCYDDNTGAVKLNINEGTPPYRVSANNSTWEPGDSIFGLPASASLPLYIRDANDCPLEIAASINEPDELIVAEDSVVHAKCNESNGAIQTFVTGGTSATDYQYLWYYLDSAQTFAAAGDRLENIYSGQYSVTVTDDHNCENSLSFIVTDVDGPKINAYETDSVSCFTGNDGVIHITEVSGGKPEYRYFLNDIQGTAEFTGLQGAIYHIRILDSKNCKFDNFIEVSEPDALDIQSVSTSPVCHNTDEGSIVAVASGGNGGYTYLWETGDNTPVLENLKAGNYLLSVTDRKNCIAEQSIAVEAPAAPTAGWENNSALLCSGNDLSLDAGDFMVYEWQKDGLVFSSQKTVTLDEGGTYLLHLTDALGCQGTDTFLLEVSDHPLDALLLLPDSAHVNETVNAIDVTWPAPDSIRWMFDKPVELLESNNWSQHFLVDEEGLVLVTLRAYFQGCYSDSSKTVMIYYEDGWEQKSTLSNNPLILGCLTYPNPNDGNFSIKVKLSREADLTLALYSGSDGNLLDRKEYKASDEYEIPYAISNLQAGVYLILVRAENEQQVLKIIIK